MPINYKNYPANWLSEIRPRIMKRANDKCEICGLSHKQIVFAIKIYVNNKWRSIWFSSINDAKREDLYGNMKKVKVIITIAHLDHDASNINVPDERLKAMCQICHLRYDKQTNK